jgi:hypothetical protein
MQVPQQEAVVEDYDYRWVGQFDGPTHETCDHNLDLQSKRKIPQLCDSEPKRTRRPAAVAAGSLIHEALTAESDSESEAELLCKERGGPPSRGPSDVHILGGGAEPSAIIPPVDAKHRRITQAQVHLLSEGSPHTRRIMRACLLGTELLSVSDLNSLLDADLHSQGCGGPHLKHQHVGKGQVVAAHTDYGVLASGGDLSRKLRNTSVSFSQVVDLVHWMMANCHYRPGRLRNVRVMGQMLRGLPVYVRNEPEDDLFRRYTAEITRTQRVGRHLFGEMVHALGDKEREHAGMSYFYVEHIDIIAVVRKMLARIEEAAFVGDPPASVKHALTTARAEVEYCTDFLRHQFRSSLSVSSGDVGRCCTYAVGGECNDHDHADCSGVDGGLLRALAAGTSVKGVLDAVRAADPSPTALVEGELDSMDRLATILGHELHHYAGHIARAWWQDTHLAEIKEKFLVDDTRAVITIDHKAKVYPKRQYEAQTDFFAKTGMSMCGAMVQWRGSTGAVEVEFYDAVLANTRTQGARELKPTLLCIIREIASQHPRLKEVIIISDNAGAFSSASNLPFVYALNKGQVGDLQIRAWAYTEAQTGKSFLDTHFSFVNRQLHKAIVRGGSFLNPDELYDSLTEGGGIKATTTLLVEIDNETATALHSRCAELPGVKEKLKKGFRAVHLVHFAADCVSVHKQTGLPPWEEKDIRDPKWPDLGESPGFCSKRSRSGDRCPIRLRGPVPADASSADLPNCEERKTVASLFQIALPVAQVLSTEANPSTEVTPAEQV